MIKKKQRRKKNGTVLGEKKKRNIINLQTSIDNEDSFRKGDIEMGRYPLYSRYLWPEMYFPEYRLHRKLWMKRTHLHLLKLFSSLLYFPHAKDLIVKLYITVFLTCCLVSYTFIFSTWLKVLPIPYFSTMCCKQTVAIVQMRFHVYIVPL